MACRVEVRGRQQVGDAGRQEVVQRAADVVVAEVEQAVAAQPEVRGRQRALRDVQVQEAALRVAVLLLQPVHDGRNDVAAGVGQRALAQHVLHPVEVAAGRVEQAPHAELLEHGRQRGPQSARVGERRAVAADALAVGPVVALVDPREAILDAGCGEQAASAPPLRAAPHQEDGIARASRQRRQHAHDTHGMAELGEGLHARLAECREPASYTARMPF